MENKEEGKACCGPSKCCGKALFALALLAIGGLGGYLCGRNCGTHQCSAKDAPVQVSAPAQK